MASFYTRRDSIVECHIRVGGPLVRHDIFLKMMIGFFLSKVMKVLWTRRDFIVECQIHVGGLLVRHNICLTMIYGFFPNKVMIAI